MKRFSKHSLWLVTALMTVAIFVHAQTATNFTAGTPISAAAVNARFAALEQAVTVMVLDPVADASSTDFGMLSKTCIDTLTAQSVSVNGAQLIPVACTVAALRKCHDAF